MSLESITSKIDGALQGIALLVAFVMWAALGFPFVPAFAGFIGLCIVAIGIWWMTSRPAKGK